MNAPAYFPPMSVPAPSKATLPQTYEAARTALAECQNIDECWTWADKAQALASYAKQAQDDTLLVMANRIKARAVRRAGELLKLLEPARGANQNIEAGSGPNVSTRKDAAREAGLSERQQKTAIRVASVPREDFERQVESPKPPTLTQLAQQGTKARPLIDLKGRDPKEFNRALHFVGDFEQYARALAAIDVEAALRDLVASERAELRAHINRIDAIHDVIVARL